MNTCRLTKTERAALFAGEPEEGRRRAMDEHLDKCPECRAEAGAVERLLKETDAVRSEIRKAMASVDWEALPARIADRALAEFPRPERVAAAARPLGWLSALRMKPALAGLAAGLVVGAAAMYFALRSPEPGRRQDNAYHASGEFLDRAELEMARRNTLDYLEKSQYVLLDVFESAGEGKVMPAAFSSGQARDLLSRKKYLNAQLDRLQMAKARAICDQIEFLFRELSEISGELSAVELQRIRDFAEERQLLLKINLVRKELESEI
jgi:hypothetical protein